MRKQAVRRRERKKSKRAALDEQREHSRAILELNLKITHSDMMKSMIKREREKIKTENERASEREREREREK